MRALDALCLLALALFCHGVEGKLQVQTKYGDVHGFEIETSSGAHIHGFFGIPYAEPPVGELRFAEPRPPQKWDGVLDATEYAADCPMNKGRLELVMNDTHPMSEDCLYLNIFAPEDPDEAHRHPVIVMFPGLSYDFGAVRKFDGTALAQKETVVVTVSYRMGVFGFLSTDDNEALGNYALLDQTEALRWIQNNIGRFGGDPKRVTIMGNFVSANMVALHLISPYSEGLFHGAIMSSGSLVSPYTVLLPPYKAVDLATELADKLGCSTESTKEIVSCLRDKTVEELVETKVTSTPTMDFGAFAPTIDGPGGVIAASPRKLLETNQFSKVPILVGTRDKVAAESLSHNKGIEFGISSEMFDKAIGWFVQRFPEKARSYIKDLILYEYTDYKESYNPASIRDSVIRATADGYVNAPMVFQSAAHAAAGGHVWMYDFHYVSDNDRTPAWRGTRRFADLVYMFGPGLLLDYDSFEFDDKDKEVHDMMMNFITDFARTGNPTPGQGSELKWPRYEGDRQQYLEIHSPKKTKVETFFKPKKTALWTYYIPKILHDAAEEGEKNSVNPFGGAR